MKNSISIVVILVSFNALAQNWQLIDSIEVNKTISAVAVDSKGHYYIGTEDGSITRYDLNDEEDEYFSELNNSSVTNIQAWNRMKVFSFFREQQTVAILDRFTTTPKNISLADLNLQYAWLFAPGVDNSFWALRTELKELVKYDDQNLNVLSRIPLQDEIKINNACFVRAFKNLLILVDEKSGFWIFDQYGDYKGRIAEKGIKHMEITNGLIVSYNGSEFLEIDPFELQVATRKKAPAGAFWAVVTSGDRYVFIQKNAIKIYTQY